MKKKKLNNKIKLQFKLQNKIKLLNLKKMPKFCSGKGYTLSPPPLLTPPAPPQLMY